VRLSLLASEVMGGMICHVTVMGTTIRIVCVPPLADIETTAPDPGPLEVMVDVAMPALLVVVIALYMEIMVVMVVAAEAQVVVEEVEATIVSEAQTTAIVGVIALVVKSSRHCLHQVQSTLSMTARSPPIPSRVSLPAAPLVQPTPILTNPCSPQSNTLRWWSHVSHLSINARITANPPKGPRMMFCEESSLNSA